MNYLRELKGQDKAVELLEQAVKRDRIAPAYLFVGMSGIGKAIAAKGFCQLLLKIDAASEQKMLAGNHPDLLWVQPTYQHQGKMLTVAEATASGLKRKARPIIRIEQIRDIIEFLTHPPLQASRSVVVIEDAHTMAEGAANALLKTLEEPGKASFILIVPRVDSILPTLVSRSQIIPFYPLGVEDMQRVLKDRPDILAQPELLAKAQGSPGEAIASSEVLQTIGPDLPSKLKNIPKNPIKVLEIAKEVESVLDTETQLWLLDYLQYWYWEKFRQRGIVEIFEKAKQYLQAYVQPRLVWECTLLAISNSS